MVNYNLGDIIKDERYDGQNFLGFSIKNMPYSLNNEWTAPKYYPFSLEDLVCVHITDQESFDGFLKPQSYIPVVATEIFSRTSKEWFFPRETLHFTLNGVVADHTGGQVQEQVYSWKNKKFAYLIPLADIIHQTISLFTHDTIVLGKIQLSPSSKVIINQNSEKVKSEIQKRGYRILEIQGVKELDPAYLEGTNLNVNHPANFFRVLDAYKIDGPYTDRSTNNILMIDGFLRKIFNEAIGNSDMSLTYDETVDELKKRIDFFSVKHNKNPLLSVPISRLGRGISVYIKFLQTLKYFYENRDTHVPYETFISQRIAINNQLHWQNNPNFPDG